ncbi:hypothetical protein D3C75_1127080 [compost metagenome]
MGGSQVTDGDIRQTISIEVGPAVFLAIGGIGDAVFGMAAPVSRVIDLAPFHIRAKQPGKCDRKGIRQHKGPSINCVIRSVPRGL